MAAIFNLQAQHHNSMPYVHIGAIMICTADVYCLLISNLNTAARASVSQEVLIFQVTNLIRLPLSYNNVYTVKPA